MTDPLRVGVLGLSHDHVWSNVQTLVERNDAVLVGAADSSEKLLAQFRERFPGVTSSDPSLFLDAHELDAVYIFSSNFEGAKLAVEAANRGLHVLIEKPIAATLSQADELLKAARKNKVRLMVNWPFAWWPQLQHALRLAGDSTIGTVWQVKYRAAHAGPRELGCSEEFCDWLFDPELNGRGGALMDYCCYGACLAQAVMGSPSRVTGIKGRFCKDDISVEDNALIAMTYQHGMATAEASWTQIGKLTSYTTSVYGSLGTLLVEPRDGGRLLLATEADQEGSVVELPPAEASLKDSAAHFIHCIRTGDEFFPLCRDSVCRDAQEILEAGLRACESGREVTLPLQL